MNKGLLITVFLMLIAAGTTYADFTPINPGSGEGAPPGEPNLYGLGGILDGIYGWDNLTRIDDDYDKVWLDLDDGEATAIEKYAAYSHQLGYSLDEIAGSSPVWLDVKEKNDTDTFDIIPNSDYFIWALWVTPNDTTPPYDLFSLDSLNGHDQMVTYKVDTATYPTYIICWSDLIGGGYAFQDFIVEVTNAQPVPEPATILLLGLGALALRRRRT